METREEILKYGMSFPDCFTDAPFHDPNWVLVRCKKNRKAFLWTYELSGRLQINLKTDPEWKDFWRAAYPGKVLPAYHMNKTHWNTVVIDGSVPEEDLKRMIGESYGLVKGGTE